MKFNKSMVEYVLDKQRFSEIDSIAVFNITNYADFLSKKLELWMFVACDENGNVLEEPQKISDKNWSEEQLSDWAHDCKEYQTALSKVIFEGFEIENIGTTTIWLENGKHNICFTDRGKVNFNGADIKTIEDLIPYNLEIKESVAKELGLI